MAIYELIRKYRKEAHLSQEELAEKVFVSKQALSLYENGKRTLKYETVVSLLEVFGKDLSIIEKQTKPVRTFDSPEEKRAYEAGWEFINHCILSRKYQHINNQIMKEEMNRRFGTSEEGMETDAFLSGINEYMCKNGNQITKFDTITLVTYADNLRDLVVFEVPKKWFLKNENIEEIGNMVDYLSSLHYDETERIFESATKENQVLHFVEIECQPFDEKEKISIHIHYLEFDGVYDVDVFFLEKDSQEWKQDENLTKNHFSFLVDARDYAKSLRKNEKYDAIEYVEILSSHRFYMGEKAVWLGKDGKGLFPCHILCDHGNDTYDLELEYTHLGEPVIEKNVDHSHLKEWKKS